MMTQTMTNNFKKCSKIKGLRVVLGGVRFPSAAEIKETAWLQGKPDFPLNRAVFRCSAPAQNTPFWNYKNPFGSLMMTKTLTKCKIL